MSWKSLLELALLFFGLEISSGALQSSARGRDIVTSIKKFYWVGDWVHFCSSEQTKKQNSNWNRFNAAFIIQRLDKDYAYLESLVQQLFQQLRNWGICYSHWQLGITDTQHAFPLLTAVITYHWAIAAPLLTMIQDYHIAGMCKHSFSNSTLLQLWVLQKFGFSCTFLY